MNFIPYTSQPYDTWALIAHRAYGESHRWKEITDANPHVALQAMPTPGTKLWIPVVELPVVSTTVTGLPSWRQSV